MGLQCEQEHNNRGYSAGKHAARIPWPSGIVGPHSRRQIQFVMPMNADKNSPKADVDGLLPTMLFQRI